MLLSDELFYISRLRKNHLSYFETKGNNIENTEKKFDLSVNTARLCFDTRSVYRFWVNFDSPIRNVGMVLKGLKQDAMAL